MKYALIAFDHENPLQHANEINLGAVEVIAKCLQRALHSINGQLEEDYLCSLLLMVFRCSDACAVATVEKEGATFLPLTLALTSRYRERPSSIRCYFTAKQLTNRICELGLSLHRLRNSDIVLLSIVRNLRRESSSVAAKLLAGLTVHRESKALAMRFPGLLEAVVERACASSCGQCALVLHNLAWESSNKAEMGRKRGLLEAVGRLTRVTSDITRATAYATLGFLSTDASNRIPILKVNSGNLLKNSLVELCKEADGGAKIHVIRMLCNLISSQTAKTIAMMPGLLRCLIRTAQEQGDVEIATVAAKVVRNLAGHISVRDSSHPAVVDALLKMAQSTKLEVVLWTARGFVEQSLQIDSSFFIVRSPKVLYTILQLSASKQPKVAALGVEVLANLSRDSSNAKRLTTNGRVLSGLVDHLQTTTTENEDARRQAVRAALYLASHKSTSRLIAKQFDMIPSLSRYGTSNDEDVDLKKAALHGVVMLAPSM